MKSALFFLVGLNVIISCSLLGSETALVKKWKAEIRKNTSITEDLTIEEAHHKGDESFVWATFNLDHGALGLRRRYVLAKFLKGKLDRSFAMNQPILREWVGSPELSRFNFIASTIVFYLDDEKNAIHLNPQGSVLLCSERYHKSYFQDSLIFDRSGCFQGSQQSDLYYEEHPEELMRRN